jgi:Mce-associated membrane protein
MSGTDDQRTTPNPWVRRGVLLGMVIVLVAAILTLRTRLDDETERRTSFPTAAVLTSLEPRVADILSYTPENVSADLPAETAYLTGSFKDEFTQLVDEVIAPAATRDSVTTSAEVVSSAVVSADAQQMVTLMFVNLTTDSAQLPEARVSGSRLRVTLSEVGGDWLISGLDPV